MIGESTLIKTAWKYILLFFEKVFSIIFKSPLLPILVSSIIFILLSIFVIWKQNDILGLDKFAIHLTPEEFKTNDLHKFKLLSNLYFGIFYISLAVFFYMCPIINIKVVLKRLSKVDLTGWPLENLFKRKCLLSNKDDYTEKENLNAFIKNLWDLSRRHEHLLEELNQTIKLPLENLANIYIAEVRFDTPEELSTIDNVALVRIRHVSVSSEEKKLSSGSLIYEGISFDTEKNVYYWQTTPLCIDLFSLPHDGTNATINGKKSNLLFKTTKGKIIKFVYGQEPNLDCETIENFGDINVPRDLFSNNPNRTKNVPIVGLFTDIVTKNGKTETKKKTANMQLLQHQINQNVTSRKAELIEKFGVELLADARDFMNTYDGGEILHAMRTTYINNSSQFLKSFEQYIVNDTYWKEDAIFPAFKKNQKGLAT